MSPSAKNNFWDDGLRLISYCPLCQSEFHPMDAQLLGQRGERHLVHVRCQKCGNSMLALVLMGKAGVSSVGLVTDLTYDDVLKFRSARRIGVDDVIAVHEALKTGRLLTALVSSD